MIDNANLASGLNRVAVGAAGERVEHDDAAGSGQLGIRIGGRSRRDPVGEHRDPLDRAGRGHEQHDVAVVLTACGTTASVEQVGGSRDVEQFVAAVIQCRVNGAGVGSNWSGGGSTRCSRRCSLTAGQLHRAAGAIKQVHLRCAQRVARGQHGSSHQAGSGRHEGDVLTVTRDGWTERVAKVSVQRS